MDPHKFSLLNYPVKFILRGPFTFHPYEMRFSNLQNNTTIASLLDELKEYFTSELKEMNEPAFNW